MTDAEWKKIEKAIYKDAFDIGANAAEWYLQESIGGRVSSRVDTRAVARKILQGYEDGDPEIMDSFNIPNLSGEWAGDPTPQTLAEEWGLEDDDDIDEACNVWEEAVSEGYFDTLIPALRAEADGE